MFYCQLIPWEDQDYPWMCTGNNKETDLYLRFGGLSWNHGSCVLVCAHVWGSEAHLQPREVTFLISMPICKSHPLYPFHRTPTLHVLKVTESWNGKAVTLKKKLLSGILRLHFRTVSESGDVVVHLYLCRCQLLWFELGVVRSVLSPTCELTNIPVCHSMTIQQH